MKTCLLWLWRVLPIPEKMRYFLMWLFNPKFVVGTAALILNKRGEVLLFKHSYRQDTPWGFPGGYLKKGENPDEAIQREIMEESGLRIHILKLLEVIVSADTPRLEVLYLAELEGEGRFAPSQEVDEMRFFPLDQLPELLEEHSEIIERHDLGAL